MAKVEVTNTTGATAAFTVKVQFESDSTVLGTGTEFTAELKAGQRQRIRMGNMQGDAEAVDSCRVLSVAVLD